MRDDIFELQHHIRSILEDIQHVAFRVLAGKAHEGPIRLLVNCEALKVNLRRRDCDPVDAVLSHHAMPQGVIAIEHQYLVCGHSQSVHFANYRQCNRRKILFREWYVSELIAQAVVSFTARHALDVGGGKKMYSSKLSCALIKADRGRIEVREEPGNCAWRWRQNAEHRGRLGVHLMLDQCIRQLADRSLDQGTRRLGIGRLSYEVFNPDQDYIGPMGVGSEQAATRKQFLEDLVVGSEFHLEIQSGFAQQEAQGR